MKFPSAKAKVKYSENFKVNYKTEMCKNWVTKGFCEFDNECAYAHGPHELNMKIN